MNAKLYKTEKENYVLVDPTKGTYDDDYTLGTSRESQFNKLSIKNCETIERGYDLDELSMGYDLYENINFVGQMRAFKAGFQKALELMGDKKFSEDDVMLGWDAGVMSQSICYTNYLGLKRDSELKNHRESYQRDLKPLSIQQKEWDVEVEMVPALSNNGNVYYGDIPKLDENGCLILKLKSE